MTPTLTSVLHVTVSLWLAGATVAIADPALAARSTDLRRQAVVRVADLDLQAPAGRATAHRRLRTAALSVCNSGGARADQACVDQAMAQGEQMIDAEVAAR